jgi:hypothetical protein
MTSLNTSIGSLTPQEQAVSKDDNTASPNVVIAPSQQVSVGQLQDEEVRQRTTESEVRITSGRPRSATEDQANTESRQKIANSVQTVSQKLITETETAARQPVPTTPEQRIMQLQTTRQVRQKSIQDNERALQRIQRTCNHRYSTATDRCVYCNKSRSSHVYDQPVATIHNVRRK